MPGAWGRGNEDLAKSEGGSCSEAAEEKEGRGRGRKGGGGGGDVGQSYGLQTSVRSVSTCIMMAYTVDNSHQKSI